MFQLYCPRLCCSSKLESLLRYFMFGPSARSTEPTMPAADSCNFIPSPLDNSSSKQSCRPPRVMRSHFHAYVRHIYSLIFPYRYRTLKSHAFSSRRTASYVISVRRTSALLTASFRFHLAMDTLAVRLTIPPVGFVGDFHSLVRAPCRAHMKKGGLRLSPPSFAEIRWTSFLLLQSLRAVGHRSFALPIHEQHSSLPRMAITGVQNRPSATPG